MEFIVAHPLTVLPLFIAEEFGIPLPLVLSGLFTYAGYTLHQGTFQALLLIPVNMMGALLGAATIYWSARAGRALPVWHRLAGGRTDRVLKRLEAKSSWGLLPVMGARLLPLPMILVSAAFGVVQLPFRTYTLAVLLTVPVWNVVFMAGGFAAGVFSTRLPETASPLLRYAPVLGVWLGIILALALWRRRRTRGRAASPRAPAP